MFGVDWRSTLNGLLPVSLGKTLSGFWFFVLV
uniref:Uncharacterized protein n=1 Tax=Arundo donax TaxID=35708 RepID=A0A0A9BHG6_ARUDO